MASNMHHFRSKEALSILCNCKALAQTRAVAWGQASVVPLLTIRRAIPSPSMPMADSMGSAVGMRNCLCSRPRVSDTKPHGTGRMTLFCASGGRPQSREQSAMSRDHRRLISQHVRRGRPGVGWGWLDLRSPTICRSTSRMRPPDRSSQALSARAMATGVPEDGCGLGGLQVAGFELGERVDHRRAGDPLLLRVDRSPLGPGQRSVDLDSGTVMVRLQFHFGAESDRAMGGAAGAT